MKGADKIKSSLDKLEKSATISFHTTDSSCIFLNESIIFSSFCFKSLVQSKPPTAIKYVFNRPSMHFSASIVPLLVICQWQQWPFIARGEVVLHIQDLVSVYE